MDAAVADGPAARIVAAASASLSVTDAQARRLTVRRLSALDKLRLFKVAGPQLAHNAPWLGMAMLAYSVAAIDDVPIPAPSTEAQIEALVARLGDAGIAAAASALEPEAPLSAMAAATAGN